ncbi:MAG: SMC-Scp complex subunit ScpB [Acidobacteriia bacterium]|nr:SMC-Scp complex subunit ScpB [Terriglobia bacterium]
MAADNSRSIMSEAKLRPIIEALIYLAEEPLTLESMVKILGKENEESIRNLVKELKEFYQKSDSGIEIKEVADGFKMSTKPEYHDWVQQYIKYRKGPVRLSLAALETLAVIAYKQPVTLPEIQDVRGVNAVGVMKNLIEKKLVTTGGRKNVIGRPILYKTTKDFLLQFGLKNLSELPNLEEYQEMVQASMAENDPVNLSANDSGNAKKTSTSPISKSESEEIQNN